MKSKLFRKILSFVLSVIMTFSCFGFAVNAAQKGESIVLSPAAEKNYLIDSPYDEVNWNTWRAYKTQLHCHTNASDGYLTVREVVQLSYDLGYDILAITDHGTLNRGWNNVPQTKNQAGSNYSAL